MPIVKLRQLVIFCSLLVILTSLTAVITFTDWFPVSQTPQQYVSEPSDNQIQSGWQLVTPPVGSSLYSLDMLNTAEGWAGGSAGTALHNENGYWSLAGIDSDCVVDSLSMVQNDWGFAGMSTGGCNGSGNLYHYYGGSWHQSANLGIWIDDIDMLSSTDGWLVGEQNSIYRYQGGNWIRVTSPIGPGNWLTAINMVDAGFGAITAQNYILNWNGSSWSVKLTNAMSIFKDVSFVNRSDGWAVGYECVDSCTIMRGVLYHWDGNNWSLKQSLPNYTVLNSVSMVSPTSGWAVGNLGNIYRFNGSQWVYEENPTPAYFGQKISLEAVEMLSDSDGWVVGERGTILHYTGGSIPPTATPTTRPPTATPTTKPPTATPTRIPSVTPTRIPTGQPTATPTAKPPTATPTKVPGATATPTVRPTATVTPKSTATPTPAIGTCGDGVCQAAESKTTCYADCCSATINNGDLNKDCVINSADWAVMWIYWTDASEL
jgi:hypothetical protein